LSAPAAREPAAKRHAILICGDVLAVLRTLPAEAAHCCVTSPPYYGLRDYGLPPQVWGGVEGCRHEFIAEPRAVQRGKGGNWQQAENGPGLKSGRTQTRFRGDTRAARDTAERATALQGFCIHCGAWRGSLGLEPTPDLYVEHLLVVFQEVQRVLRADGTLWLNLGDSYCHASHGSRVAERWPKPPPNGHRLELPGRYATAKPKDLLGVPWRLALALQAAGWWLRRDIVWSKPNPMPESVVDRPTTSHEYLFLLAKSRRYFYDAAAVREPDVQGDHPRRVLAKPEPSGGLFPSHSGIRTANGRQGLGRSLRSVWTIAPAPFLEAHFATFPPALAERCIRAGTSERGCCRRCGAPWCRITLRTGGGFHSSRSDAAEGQAQDGRCRKQRYLASLERPRGTTGWQPGCRCEGAHSEPLVPALVIDPFAGAGTTALVALRLGRAALGIELNASYCELARHRIERDAPLLNDVSIWTP
jgi:DNA modification methylase